MLDAWSRPARWTSSRDARAEVRSSRSSSSSTSGTRSKARTGRDGQPITTDHYVDYIRKELKGLAFAPIAFMSAKDGLNIEETIELAFELYEQAGTRVGTGVLNRLIRGIIDTRGPISKAGTFAKIYYVAQVRANPPTIILVVNKPELFNPNYMRYLMNRLREELPFTEVPMRARGPLASRQDQALGPPAGSVRPRQRRGRVTAPPNSTHCWPHCPTTRRLLQRLSDPGDLPLCRSRRSLPRHAPSELAGPSPL